MAIALAPWLRPTDVVGSASAGANIGLAARARDLQAAAQRQAAAEFAAKLNQQAYQFAAEQDLAASRLAAAQDEHAARLAAELRQQDALDAYRQGELKVRSRANDIDAARLLRANFEPRVVDVGGNKLLQVEPNRYTLAPSNEPFMPQKVVVDGEELLQTGPRSFSRLPAKTQSLANDPNVIIAKSALSHAGSDPVARAAAEQALREAMATPEQREAAAGLLRQNLEADRLRVSAAREKLGVTKDGRKAYFDADTKAFIRYAE